ncbi:Clathrin adaptor complex small chain family protein, partial [Prunus dulcis]
IHFVILVSRQGKVRLTKWFSPYTQKERSKVMRELSGIILNRGPKLCNFVEWRGFKVVYKRYKITIHNCFVFFLRIIMLRYASLYFCMCVDQNDNELETLEIIHHYVEILDRYFGSVSFINFALATNKRFFLLLVCELDLIFNFHKAYYILDELLLAGELQESSKRTVGRMIATHDRFVEVAKEEASSIGTFIAQVRM